MSVFDKIGTLLQDPPPEFAFEVTADSIAMARTKPPIVVQHASLAPGVVTPSPLKINIADVAAFAAAVKRLVPAAAGRGRRSAAVILPDNAMRTTVLDFETLPEREEDRLALIRFRLRKTVPFDVDEAALAWTLQPGNRVVAAVTPSEVVAQYESAFRSAGLHPGFVTASSLAALELLPQTGSALLVHRSPGALTVMAIQDGVLLLSRSLELSSDHLDEIAEISEDVFPTIVYAEDRTGVRPAKMFLAGFGPEATAAATRLSVELDIPAEVLTARHPGLSGYLRSLNPAAAAQVAA